MPAIQNLAESALGPVLSTRTGETVLIERVSLFFLSFSHHHWSLSKRNYV